MTKKSEVLTEKEARKYLGCSRNTFKNYVDTGVLEVIEIKKKKYSEILVKRTELHRFLDGKLIINEENKSKKIVKKLAGSALMRDEPLAVDIMDQTVKAVNVPVTVKMRLGWDDDSLNAPRLAKMAEDVGIKMITVHGRTRNQMYKGQANWQAVRAVKDAVNVPVIINGDIASPEDAKRAMEMSGADGVMIGRGCCGKPWLLKQTMDYLSTGTASAPPASKEIFELITAHYDAMLNYYGDRQGVAIARKHLAWYCTGLEGANAFRSEINKAKDPALVKEMLHDYFIKRM